MLMTCVLASIETCDFLYQGRIGEVGEVSWFDSYFHTSKNCRLKINRQIELTCLQRAQSWPDPSGGPPLQLERVCGCLQLQAWLQNEPWWQVLCLVKTIKKACTSTRISSASSGEEIGKSLRQHQNIKNRAPAPEYQLACPFQQTVWSKNWLFSTNQMWSRS